MRTCSWPACTSPYLLEASMPLTSVAVAGSVWWTGRHPTSCDPPNFSDVPGQHHQDRPGAPRSSRLIGGIGSGLVAEQVELQVRDDAFHGVVEVDPGRLEGP